MSSSFSATFYTNVLDKAAQRGDFQVVRWLIRNGCRIGRKTLELAVGSNNLELCYFLECHNAKVTLKCTELAVKAHNFPLFQWLFSKQCPVYPTATIVTAAANGNMEVLDWIPESEYQDSNSCTAAAKTGNLELVLWTRERGCDWDESTAAAAAESGNLDVLRYVLENKCPYGSNLSIHVAKSGSIEGLKYIEELGLPIRSGCYGSAAEKGNLELLEWLLQKGVPKTEFACDYAAAKGDLKTLKWLQENQFDWSQFTLENSAPHPEIFKWLRSNGCPWGILTIPHIILEKNVDLSRWALEQGCTTEPHICNYAAKHGNISILKVLVEFKYQFTLLTCENAAAAYDLGMLQWLVKNGAQISNGVYNIAKHNQDKEMKRWLRLHNCDFDDSDY